MESGRTEIPGSEQPLMADTPTSDLSDDREFTITIVLRPKAESADVAEKLLSGQFRPRSREEQSAMTGADPADVAAVESFVRQYGLEVIEADAAKRTVKVRGSVQNLDRAFGIQLAQFGDYVSYGGAITVPTSVAGKILAVLGLSTKPVARLRVLASPTLQ